MEYLLIASAASFIAACIAVLVMAPRVQSRERPLASTERGPGVTSAPRP